MACPWSPFLRTYDTTYVRIDQPHRADPPGDGWDYLGLLDRFQQEVDPTPQLFAEAAVDTYMDSYPDNFLYNFITLASYDLTRMDALALVCDDMAAALCL